MFLKKPNLGLSFANINIYQNPMIRRFLLLISIFIITACSSSYERLETIDFKTSNNFSKNLVKFYKEKAIFEAKEMHDWNSAKLYSEKALKAIEGEEIQPQEIDYWNIPKKNVLQIQKSYNNLMEIYNEAKIIDPYNLAKAISSLDCWAEQQEEEWQIWDINKCRDDFLNSMHLIYKKITESNKNENKKSQSQNNINSENGSVSVVTKNENEKIMHIIYFDFDKSNLSETSKNKIQIFLDEVRDKIKNYIIVGHTDTKGTKEYNLNLSQKRALAIKDILIEMGIKKENLRVLGKGEEMLAVPTKDEVKHPANRRAEITALN